MTYVVPGNDLQTALQLHAENKDGQAYRHIADAIDRDRGEVHPCVIDWLLLSAEAGRKKSWAKALGFQLNNAESERVSRSIAENFFNLLKKKEGLLPSMETIITLNGMSAQRELGMESKTLASCMTGRSTLQRFITNTDKAN